MGRITSDISRRNLLRGAMVAAGLAVVPLSACGSGGSGSSSRKIGANIDEITELAKKEGKVVLIAYPKTWANYAGHFAAFQKKYGVKVEVQSPDISSAEELQAIKTLKGQANQPDVLDIGYSFTQTAISQNLIEAYKPTNFDSIPDALKDPDGKWVGAYYGALSIGVNTKLVKKPASFKDLLGPEYKGKIALPGDPRKGASSMATVFAASLANGGSLDDIGPGIDYFAQLAKAGNLVTISSVSSGLSTGQAAVTFDWNYNFLGIADQMKKSGVELDYWVPQDGIFGNYYAQPATIESPQPNAARLWINWLTSDEGSEQYALGGAVPARFTELSKAGKLSKKALANLPDPEVLAKIKFPTIDQGNKANQTIASEWAQKVKI